MPVTDPIADMLTRIRNALIIFLKKVDMPSSRMKVAIASILKDEGFVKDYQLIKGEKQVTLRIYLKYGENGEKVIRGLKRVSRPGRRVYVKSTEIPRVLQGLGISILSTSQGLKSGQSSTKANLGGELLCYIW